jgi:antitoxin ParD1/3/4
MPARNVILTDHHDTFIETRITSGRFSDASEAVSEGLRLLEERETGDQSKLEWLRSAAQDSFAALDRGEGTSFDSIDDLAAYIDETAEKLTVQHRRG